jgi:Tol biopolymer transport system component
LIKGHVNGSWWLYAMNADGTNLHSLLPSTDPESDDYWGGAAYAADGGRIFYTRPYQRESTTGTCCTLWAMNADGGDPHEFRPSTGEAWDGQAVVSPDGTQVAYWHVGDDARIAVVSADGTGPVVETGPPLPTAHWVWAPTRRRS